MTEYSDDIFEFNDDLASTPQSPSLESTPGSPYEDFGYTYTNYGYASSNTQYSTSNTSVYSGSEYSSDSEEDHFEPFLYECCICKQTHTQPCEHSEEDMNINNQWLMSNYRKWQTSVVRI